LSHPKPQTEEGAIMSTADHDTCPVVPGATGPDRSPQHSRTIHDLRTPLAVELTETGARTRAVVFGEVDLSSAPALRLILEDTLRQHDGGGLDIDLSRVRFFDCAGLNVLLQTRELALCLGNTVAVTAVSPTVERLLALCGMHPLFAPAPAPAPVEHAADRPAGSGNPAVIAAG
jgi:anti-anti-sigma factor